jgi:hypothetical protein
MNAAAMARQLIDFQRTLFNTSFDIAKMFQEQAETAGAFWQKRMGVPETAQKFVGQWMSVTNKGRDDFKKMMDDGFDKMEGFFAAGMDGKSSGPADTAD